MRSSRPSARTARSTTGAAWRTGTTASARGIATDNIGKQSHFELIDIERETAPETYLVHLAVTGNGFNGTSPFRFTLRDGLIQSVVIVPD
ncbi:hypothetical protein [Microbacterium sp. LWS13-1.2]|uniref:Uncharacterized protein n=1 Tax=Microbacterium sp. LWS13-1.2 TaxID=3135264 RepID=A0AAU6SAE6_9MICO